MRLFLANLKKKSNFADINRQLRYIITTKPKNLNDNEKNNYLMPFDTSRCFFRL